MKRRYLPLPITDFHTGDDGRIILNIYSKSYTVNTLDDAQKLCRTTQKIFMIASIVVALVFALSLALIFYGVAHAIVFKYIIYDLCQYVPLALFFLLLYSDKFILYFLVNKRAKEFGITGKIENIKRPEFNRNEEASELHIALLKISRKGYVVELLCAHACLLLLAIGLIGMQIQTYYFQVQLNKLTAEFADDPTPPIKEFKAQSKWGKSVEKQVNELLATSIKTEKPDDSFQTALVDYGWPCLLMLGLFAFASLCRDDVKLLRMMTKEKS